MVYFRYDRIMAAAPPTLTLAPNPRQLVPASGRLSTMFPTGPVRAQTWPQPADDEAATAQTIAVMSEMARRDAWSEPVREAAHQAAAGATTPRGIAAAVHAWIQSRIKFVEDLIPAGLAGVEDPAQAEVLIRPADLLAMREPAGDCDDFSMLCASMLLALGIEPKFKTVAADPTNPGAYSHVYVVANLPRRVGAGAEDVAIDASHGPHIGWEAGNIQKARVWPIMEAPQQGNLGAIDWGAIINSGVNATTNILTARYANPPAGTYVQTNADGSQTYYRQQPGAIGLQFPTVQSSGTTTLLLGLAGLAVLLVLMKR